MVSRNSGLSCFGEGESKRRSEDGEWVQTSLAICGTPVGILMYDANGNMAVQITISPRTTECPSDRPNWVHGYTAYYGNYEVDPPSQLHRSDRHASTG